MLIKILPKLNSPLIFNFFLCLIPFSMILGNTAININTLLICFIGLYVILRNKLKFKINLLTKIVFLFLATTTIAALFSVGFDFSQYNPGNSYYENFIKSLLFFRWLLFLIVIQTLNKYDLIDFNFLFYSFCFFGLVVALDIIFQNFVGFNFFGFSKFVTPLHGHLLNTGFFGDEIVAGGFIQRFSFYSIFLSMILLENKNKIFKYLFLPLFVSVFPFAIFLSTNRMPLILMILGIVILGIIYRKYLIQIILSLVIFLFLVFSLGTERQKQSYESLYSNVINIKSMFYQVKIVKKNGVETRTMKHADVASKSGSGHFYIYNTVINIWKENKLLGIGPKNFYERCVESEHHLNRLCVNHPHSYILDILVSTGILGILLSVILSIYLIIISYKKIFLPIGSLDKKDIIVIPTIIVFLLEIFPFRSSGGFFTSGTSIFIFLIIAILISKNYKAKIN